MHFYYDSNCATRQRSVLAIEANPLIYRLLLWNIRANNVTEPRLGCRGRGEGITVWEQSHLRKAVRGCRALTCELASSGSKPSAQAPPHFYSLGTTAGEIITIQKNKDGHDQMHHVIMPGGRDGLHKTMTM